MPILPRFILQTKRGHERSVFITIYNQSMVAIATKMYSSIIGFGAAYTKSSSIGLSVSVTQSPCPETAFDPRLPYVYSPYFRVSLASFYRVRQFTRAHELTFTIPVISTKETIVTSQPWLYYISLDGTRHVQHPRPRGEARHCLHR